MDDRFLEELTEDLDHMRILLERCVGKLRSRMRSGNTPVNIGHQDIRAEIERQRQLIMAQANQARAQIMQAANTKVKPPIIEKGDKK